MHRLHPSSIARMAVCLVVVATSVAGQHLDGGSLLMSGDLPVYPPLAIQARLEGSVRLSLQVRQGVVKRAEPISASHALLTSAARRNVLSWQFAPGVSGVTEVTFVYEIEGDEVITPENPEITMKIPEYVRVVARPVRPWTESKPEWSPEPNR